MSAISWQSIVAVDAYIIGGIVDALITINHPAYESTRWARTLFTILVVIFVAAFNIFAASHLSIAEGVFATFHVFILVPVCVTLWVMVSPKTDPAEVFVHFRDHTGSWPNTGMSVLVGQTTAIFTTIRYDAVAHMTEEVKGAASVVPSAMIWSFMLNLPLTFVMLFTYVFNIGSIDDALNSPYTFIRVLQNALETTETATGFAIAILFLVIMITISTMAATSRQAFAFARDGGFPFSRWIGCVSSRFGVPVNAILLTAAFTCVLVLIDMHSTVAFDTITSLSCSAVMATYVLSIGCITLKRIRKRRLPRARWSLGKAGLPINCAALVYVSWGCFWPLWPTEYNIRPSNFNWAIVIFASLMGLAGLYYYRGARKTYEGPISKVQDWMQDW